MQREQSLDHPPSMALSHPVSSRGRKQQPEQKRNKHLFANIPNKKCSGLTISLYLCVDQGGSSSLSYLTMYFTSS